MNKRGFQLGEMPLTLFILVAAAIVYLHLSGKGLGSAPKRGSVTLGPEMHQDTATGRWEPSQEEPVQVNPPAPSVPLPKFEMPKPSLVPIPGDAGIGGSILEP